MSDKLAGFAGFLVVAAMATPHLPDAMMPPHLGSTAVRVADAPAAPPVVVAAARVNPLPQVVLPPAYVPTPTSDPVAYGDAKTADFDPDNPPADMGEPG